MRITFNLQDTGLGNNGGSATIIRSVHELMKQGHEVCLVCNNPNNFTWFTIEAEVVHTDKGYFRYPDGDVIIATGFQSVKHVERAPNSKGVKWHWIRAHESWITKDLKSVYHASTFKMVNSVCLKDFILREYGTYCDIIYPGIDGKVFRNLRPERHSEKHKGVHIGALYNMKKRKRFNWIVDVFIKLKSIYKNEINFYLFGDTCRPQNLPFDFTYIKQPTTDVLVDLYNRIHIWLAPTESEGLHICPVEAQLCGCLVVGTNAELAGMRDWLEHGVTGFVSQNDLKSFFEKTIDAIEMPESEANILVNNAINIIRKKIGTRYKNMKRMVKLLEGKL